MIDSGGHRESLAGNGGGGITSGVTIDGGVQIIGGNGGGGGTTFGTIINQGGLEYLSEGVASGTIINSGGVLDNSAVATGTIISNGGVGMLLAPPGTAAVDSGAAVLSGGTLAVEGDGTAIGRRVISGRRYAVGDLRWHGQRRAP